MKTSKLRPYSYSESSIDTNTLTQYVANHLAICK